MLNSKEQRVFDFIKSYIDENGFPPAIREIGRALDIKSTSTVHLYLNKLSDKGYIVKQNLKTRALKIAEDKLPKKEDKKVENTKVNMEEEINSLTIPLIGNVAAGAPILAEENIEDYIKVPTTFIRRTKFGQNIFMLKVKGESMIEVGIYDGDYIIIAEENTARDGEIVVALIGDEATVKTYYKEKDHIRLQPENKDMDPILVRDVKILGKVIGLYRKM